MPDFGPHGAYILFAYGASVLILGAMIASSLHGLSAARRRLRAIEQRLAASEGRLQ